MLYYLQKFILPACFTAAEWGASPRESVTVMPPLADKSDTQKQVIRIVLHSIRIFCLSMPIEYADGHFLYVRHCENELTPIECL